MSKKRRTEEVITVEDEALSLKEKHTKNSLTSNTLAYRSSIEVLKSCGIEGKELETAMLVSII